MIYKHTYKFLNIQYVNFPRADSFTWSAAVASLKEVASVVHDKFFPFLFSRNKKYKKLKFATPWNLSF